MTTAEFKKVGRLLKEAYKELEAEAIADGVDIFSEDFEILRDMTREAVLKQLGFTLEEYREAKAKVQKFTQADLVSEIEKADGRFKSLEETHITTTEEIEKIAGSVAEEVAEKVAQKYIKPPQIINQIIKETTVEKPINKTNYVIEKHEFDSKPLKQELKALGERIDGLPKPIDFQVWKEAVKSDITQNFGKMFEHNINMLGMPDFRKLAMGLQSQIDAMEGSDIDSVSNSDGTLTISPTTGAVVASLNLSNANTWLAEQTFKATGNGTTILSGTDSDGNLAFSFPLTAGGNAQFNMYNSAAALTNQITTSGDSFFNGGDVVIGATSTTLGKLEVRSTSGAQIVASYDSSNYLTIAATSGGFVTYNAEGFSASHNFSDVIQPTIDNGSALGSASMKWSDLFLASGGVINWNAGNATLTHSAGLLTSNVDIAVPDEAYGAGWNGSLEVPTKNAVYDKIESLVTGVASVTGTADRITIGGTAANPTVDIAATYVGQTSITTLGTITTGTWNGTTVAVANGGTGLTSISGDWLSQYALLAGRATPQQMAFGTAASASTGYLTSTAHATKGKYFLNSAGTMPVDELNLRIGIGVASPTYSVDVHGTSKYMNVNETSTGSSGFICSLAGTVKTFIAVAGAANGLVQGSVAGDFCFRVQGQSILYSTNSGTTAHMVLDTSGNLGVGTGTTISAKVHVDQSSTTAAIPVLTLDQADLSEEFINFVATVGTGNPIEAVGAKTLTTTHFIRVQIEGVGYKYFAVGDIA